jgi:hypothetical protein
MDGVAEVSTVRSTMHEQLSRTKTAMRRRWEMVPYMRRTLPKGQFLKGVSAELGGDKDVVEAYVGFCALVRRFPCV